MDWGKLVEKLMQLWRTWKLDGFVLCSFSLQCILILGAALRIKTSRWYVHRLILFAYLLADGVAYYTIGLTFSVGEHTGESIYDQNASEIHAFWAPFLLLHIGGPITIAGFALQDNDLWGRSVLHAIVQVSATGYVIYQSLPQNRLLAPTLLMFLAAFTRYVGRIYALYKGTPDGFLMNGGPSMSKIESQHWVVNGMHNDYKQVQRVIDLYSDFETVKVAIYGFSVGLFSKYQLQGKNAYEVFTDMEIQLGFAYDLFYTKIWTIIQDRFGALLHLVSWVSEVGALVLWASAYKRGRYWPSDIRVTNILLLGGVVVDVYSMLRLIFSDLMIPRLKRLIYCCPVVAHILEPVLLARDQRYCNYIFPLRRWSRSIKQFNLMRYKRGLPRCFTKTRKTLKDGIRKITGIDMDVSTIKLSDDMWTFIFNGFKKRVHFCGNEIDLGKMLASNFLRYVWEQYDEEVTDEDLKKLGLVDLVWRENNRLSGLLLLEEIGLVSLLMLWYYFTVLFYTGRIIEEPGEKKTRKLVSEQISEYLVYIFYRQPVLLERAEPNVTLALMEAAPKLMEEDMEAVKEVMDEIQKWSSIIYDLNRKSTRILNGGVPTEDEIHARELVDKLKRLDFVSDQTQAVALPLMIFLLGEDGAEELINAVWVELLLVAAANCNSRRHMELLSQGGELLTIVWLLMINAGFNVNL